MRIRKPTPALPGVVPTLFEASEDGAKLSFHCFWGRHAYLMVTTDSGLCLCFNGPKSLRALARTILKETLP